MGILRVIFALAVVISHQVSFFGLQFTGSILAVQSFYIISGFYMGLILEKKYSLSQYKLFITNRFLRLAPVYWVIILCMILASVVWGFFSESHSGLFFDSFLSGFSHLPFGAACLAVFSNIFIVFQDAFLFLGIDSNTHLQFVSNFKDADLSMAKFLLVPQAWTVGLEIMFYLLVPLLSRLKTGWLFLIALASLSFRLIAYGNGYNFDPWTYRFFPFELMFFILGLIAFKIYSLVRTKDIKKQIINGIYILIVCFICLYQFIPLTEGLKYILFIIAFSAALPFIFMKFRTNKFDRQFGELSYPIYICHMFVIVIVGAFSSKFDINNKTLISLVEISFTFIFSYFLVHYISNPIDKYRQKRLLKAKNE